MTVIGRVLWCLIKSTVIIHLDVMSPLSSIALPETVNHVIERRHSSVSCLAFLRVGFTELFQAPETLVSSYLTFSPLPRIFCGRYIFCGTFLGVTPTSRYEAPFSEEPGLSSFRANCGKRLPALSRAYKIFIYSLMSTD